MDCEPCTDPNCEFCAYDNETCCRCTIDEFANVEGKCKPVCSMECKEHLCEFPGKCSEGNCLDGWYFEAKTLSC